MRQPLDDGKVTVARAAENFTFPTEFMLVAATHPMNRAESGSKSPNGEDRGFEPLDSRE